MPIFGAWRTSTKSANFLVRRVLGPRRLPVVLALDKTLLHSVHQRDLEARLERLRGDRRDRLQAVVAAAPNPEAERLARARVAGLRDEEALLASDFRAMEGYLIRRAVTLRGSNGEQIHHPVQ